MKKSEFYNALNELPKETLITYFVNNFIFDTENVLKELESIDVNLFIMNQWNKERELYVQYKSLINRKTRFMKSLKKKHGDNYKLTSLTLSEINYYVLLKKEIKTAWKKYKKQSKFLDGLFK